MNKLKESLNKVNSKYLKENTAKKLFILFAEAREYVEPGVADKIQQIIDLLKQEDHTNMHSRQKFVDLLYQLTELENDSDDRRTSVRKFFKYVSRAISDYETDIADDSDILGESFKPTWAKKKTWQKTDDEIAAESIGGYLGINPNTVYDGLIKYGNTSFLEVNRKISKGGSEMRKVIDAILSMQPLEENKNKEQNMKLKETGAFDRTEVNYINNQIERLDTNDYYIRLQNESGKTNDFSLNSAFIMNLLIFYLYEVSKTEHVPKLIINFMRKYKHDVKIDTTYYKMQFKRLYPITEYPIKVKVNKYWYDLNTELLISLINVFDKGITDLEESEGKKTSKLKETEKWSGDVETKKHPPEDLFSTGSAEDIAKWAKSSHKDLQSAMGALNFYINRAGSNISTEQKNKVETAKDKLGKMYENKLNNLKNVISEAKKRIGEAAIKMSDYFDAEKRLQFYLKDKEDSTADDFANAVAKWTRKNNIVPIEDRKHNEDYDINVPGFDDTKDKFRTSAIIEIKNEYVKEFVRWLKSGEGRLYLS